MPDPLDLRVLDAVKDVAVTVSGSDVPAERHYRRPAPAVVPDRDQIPCVAVAPTPGRPIAKSKTLSHRVTVFPVTAVLAAPLVDAKVEPAWRLSWAGRLGDALFGDLAGVTEAYRVEPDELAQIDLAAYEAAGLWASSVSVLVYTRVPL